MPQGVPTSIQGGLFETLEGNSYTFKWLDLDGEEKEMSMGPEDRERITEMEAEMTKRIKKVKDTKLKKREMNFRFTVRRVNNGIEIYARSGALENLFKTLSNGDTRDRSSNEPWNKHSCYSLPAEIRNLGEYFSPTRNSENVTITKWGSNLIYNDNYEERQRYNVSFLRTQGLSKGIRMHFRGMYSAEQIEKLCACVTNMVKFLYSKYLSNIKVEVTGETH